MAIFFSLRPLREIIWWLKRTKMDIKNPKKISKNILQKNSTIMKRSHKILNILIFLNMDLIWLMKLLITIFIVQKWPFWTFLGKFNTGVCLLKASKCIIWTKLTTKIPQSRDESSPWEMILDQMSLMSVKPPPLKPRN